MSDYMEMLEALKKGEVDNPDNRWRMQGGGFLSPPRLFFSMVDQPTLFPGLAASVVRHTLQAHAKMLEIAADETSKGNDDAWGLLLVTTPRPGKADAFPCEPLRWPDLMSLRIRVDIDYNGASKIEMRSHSSTRSAMYRMELGGADGLGIHWPERSDIDETFWPLRVWAEAVCLCHLVQLIKAGAAKGGA